MAMYSFDVSLNQLTGTINNLFTNAYQLTQLVLYSNNFHGNIYTVVNPENQTVLAAIDLSDNQLSGEIPDNIFIEKFIYFCCS
jgi:hypothetical protein